MRTVKMTKRVAVCTPQPLSDFDWRGDAPVIERRAWAEIVPLSASELVKAQQAYGTVTHKVTMRRHPDPVTTEQYILVGKDKFNIVSAMDVEAAGMYVEAMVVAASGAGGRGGLR